MKLSDNKDSILHIRVTADMYNMLETLSEYNGMSISAFVRMYIEYMLSQIYGGGDDGSKIETN